MKLLKDIVYGKIEYVKAGHYDINIVINGEDLADMNVDDAINILEKNNLINNEHIVIPKGLELTSKKNINQITELNFNNGAMIVNMVIDSDDDESKYINIG